MKGLWPQVLKPLVMAPAAGFFFGFLLMGFLLWTLRKFKPGMVNRFFGKFQILSAMWVSFSYGTNDAQKTMGIITLSLTAATTAGTFDVLPDWMGFLNSIRFSMSQLGHLGCACPGGGTAAGGRRIIKTMGPSSFE